MFGDPAYEEYKRKLESKGENGPSYLTISLSEAQDLVNKYAGTGSIKLSKKRLRFKNQEIILSNKKIIGYNIDMDGTPIPTSDFEIRYSKTGTHIFPTKKE